MFTRTRTVRTSLVGVFGAGAAAYLFLPHRSRSASTVDNASLSPSHFTRATLTSSEPSGPNSKLLVLTVHGLPAQKIPPLAPIWSVFIKDDDIQVERPYTPLEGIDEQGRMLFWIKKYPRGEVGRWLHSKRVGDHVEFRGPSSTWAWKDDSWDEVVMVRKCPCEQPVSHEKIDIRWNWNHPLLSTFSLMHRQRKVKHTVHSIAFFTHTVRTAAARDPRSSASIRSSKPRKVKASPFRG
jgi:hypothetical protein